MMREIAKEYKSYLDMTDQPQILEMLELMIRGCVNFNGDPYQATAITQALANKQGSHILVEVDALDTRTGSIEVAGFEFDNRSGQGWEVARWFTGEAIKLGIRPGAASSKAAGASLQEELVQATRKRIGCELGGKHVPTRQTVTNWICSPEGVEHHVQVHLDYWRRRSASK